MDAAFYSRVWDALVEHAQISSDARDKERFVASFGEARDEVIERRVCGLLGFGGKFWRNPFPGRCPYYVNFYPEDRTPEREALAGMINALIEDLWLEHLSPQARERFLRKRA